MYPISTLQNNKSSHEGSTISASTDTAPVHISLYLGTKSTLCTTITALTTDNTKSIICVTCLS